MLIGTLIILGLGIIWAILFFQLLQMMAAKTTASVQALVNEIRIIRKGSPDHIIELNSGDELEEIAEQINKMIRNINELNQKNLDLLEINNRMEIQNLQAQINPHFIYNTLENIRYLIAVDGKKADALIEHFTHILRYNINNTKHKVPLQEDIEYLNRYRMQKALEILREGSMPLSEIGWACGIGEYKYFNFVFKKYIGCSIKTYLKNTKSV